MAMIVGALASADSRGSTLSALMCGDDTSTITVSSAAYHLARNPEWQERCRAESDALGDAVPDVAALRSLHVDLLFLGVDGLDLQFGLTTHHEAEASLNHRMVERARRIVVLTDSSKFGTISLHRIARLDEIHAIITDAGISAEYREGLQRLGIDVVIAGAAG